MNEGVDDVASDESDNDLDILLPTTNQEEGTNTSFTTSAATPSSLDATRSPSAALAAAHHPQTPQALSVSTRVWLVKVLILVAGGAAAGILLGYGITAARKDQERRFCHIADDLLTQFQLALDDYVTAGLWVWQAGLLTGGGDDDDYPPLRHSDFRILYDTIVSSGLVLTSIGLARNITHAQRPAAENFTRAYLDQNFPHDHDYQGIFGLTNADGFVGPQPFPRPPHPFYFPLRYVEPTESALIRDALDLDLYSLPPHRVALTTALTTWKPSITSVLQLSPEFTGGSRPLNFFIMMHPGEQVPGLPYNDTTSRDVSAFQFSAEALMNRAYLGTNRQEQVSLFIYDTTDDTPGQEPVFVGAARLNPRQDVDMLGRMTFHNETAMSRLHTPRGGYRRLQTMPITSRQWTFVVISEEGSFQAELAFIILGAAPVLVASVGLAWWLHNSVRRAAQLDEVQKAAAAEKTAWIIHNANSVAKLERELNDFVAHEVRNPLSTCISACSFVSSAVNKTQPLMDDESRQSVREDVAIIARGLQFINDLLRSMLDMHRASSNQIKIDLAPIDLLRDVLEPTASMLYNRNAEFDVVVDCPENLLVRRRLLWCVCVWPLGQ